MVEEKKNFYFVCIHPLACHFGDLIFNIHKRVMASAVIGFLLTLISQIHPICEQDFCYTILFQTILNPDLLVKSFSLDLILIPSLYTFFFLTLLWFAILSFLGAVQKSGKVHELVMPMLAILIFVYMAFLVSGTIGSFFLHTGLVECVNNEDCVQAGYVGEVCTSAYRPVYTTYSPDLEPLAACECIQNKCVGTP